MKNIYILFAVFFSLVSFGQDTNQNYSKKVTYKQPNLTSVSNPSITVANVEVTYYDGLGRPIQNIAHKQSNSGKDIITHMEYDSFGRQTKDYLPYPNSAPSLSYTDIISVASDLNSFHSSYNGGTSNPYSEKEMELSPMSRVFKQAAPGNSWVMNSGNEIKFQYLSNSAVDGVKKFTVEAAWNPTFERYDNPFPQISTYSANKLYKTITKDENWKSGKNHTTEEFKNNEGQVILKRTYSDIGGQSEVPHDTYYVYDQYGNLTFVIPPLAASEDLTQIVLDDLCYQYRYDYRNRLVEKKLPGKDWEYIVYNTQNMVVATGPAYNPWGENYPSEKGWVITKYDALGRVLYTGYYTGKSVSDSGRATYQSEQTGLQGAFAENISNNEPPFDGVSVGYTNKVLPMTGYKLLTISYYDDYSNPYAPTLPADVLGEGLTSHPKTLPTGSWTRVLDNSSNTTAEVSYTLYDERFRPVRTSSTNFLGGYTQVDSKMDWAGKVLETHTFHKYDANATELEVVDYFEYTDQDRLTIHTQEIIGFHDKELIANNTYDELGQLISKNVGGSDTTGTTGYQKVDYTYNVRGWLKSINDIENFGYENDLFAFGINYNDPEEGTPLYNGNISETQWITNSDGTLRRYVYTYDALNRLSNAEYSKPYTASTTLNNYKEDLTYDKNGNILTLLRNGDRDSDGAVGELNIDDLVYTYHNTKKNQLMKVFDSSGVSVGFKDDTDGTTGSDINEDFNYDGNGNMIQDENKGITNIKYNHLNLPVEITFGTSAKIIYLYNAAGQKVEKNVQDYVGGNSSLTNYLQGGFQYKDNVLKFFPHAEGYVNATVGGMVFGGGIDYDFNYVYNYTDHLGNIRLSYGLDPLTDEIKIIEENHYYPFGLKHTNYNSDQLLYQKGGTGGVVLKGPGPTTPPAPSYKYKYNGKEYQDDLVLNVTAMDFRMYDNALGRFHNMDKMTDLMPSLSPYRFAFNNPIMWSDPTGLLEQTDPPTPYIPLKEVVVTGKAKAKSSSSTPSFNYSLIDWSKVDNSRRPTLAQYNEHHGTNYQSFDDYYNNVHYKPALKKQTQAIHNSTGQAAKVCAVVAGTLVGTAYLLPVIVAASPAIESTVATLATNPIVQQKVLDVSLNVGSQLWVNGGSVGDVNLVEVTMSAVNGPGATVLGEMVNVNINSISQGDIFARQSNSQTATAVAGGIGSYAFGEATDTYLRGTGTKGKIVGMYFKFIVESASNAAPSLVE